jgi:hypothetical protein
VSDQPESIILIDLRRIDAKVDRLAEDVQELKAGMTLVEQQISNLAATQASHTAILSSRLDRVEARLDRIERRLDLVGHPAT